MKTLFKQDNLHIRPKGIKLSFSRLDSDVGIYTIYVPKDMSVSRVGSSVNRHLNKVVLQPNSTHVIDTEIGPSAAESMTVIVSGVIFGQVATTHQGDIVNGFRVKRALYTIIFMLLQNYLLTRPVASPSFEFCRLID